MKKALFIALLPILSINAQDTLEKKESRFSLHFQETTVSQYKSAFSAPYTGEHSQGTESEWATTLTSTLFGSMRLWKNSSITVNPEIAGGGGLSSAFGIAAFTNGEAFRVGNPKPSIYIARAFFRQLIPLSKEKEWQESGENKIAQYIPKKYLSFTIGKISVGDYFDDNSFSHNPRNQFLSWGLMSNGAWDYAANTRGYTPSAVLEYVTDKFEVRYGLSMMPVEANGMIMESNLNKANANSLELKYKYSIKNKPGKISALAFYNTAFMGSYTAKNIISTPDSITPDIMVNTYNITASRQYGRSKYGFGLNFEQYLTDNIGIFSRASYNDGKNETWCFTEIDRAFSIGTSIKGSIWNRANDFFGLAYCVSGLSKEHRAYLANGGLGFILGDGKLNYSNEHLIEAVYSLSLLKGSVVPSFVYQFVLNPAYNKDRGPISVYSIRLHMSI